MRTSKPRGRKRVVADHCQKCKRKGHATLLWDYRHGMYCVLCVREMMGIVESFKKMEAMCDSGNGFSWPNTGNGQKAVKP